MRTILCATDLTDASRSVIVVASSLARSLHARLELFHVVHLPPGLPTKYHAEDVLGEIRAASLTTLEKRAAELRDTGIDVAAHVALDLVDEGILKRVRSSGADLLVLGTHARHGLARVFLGSVAERIVRAASCPVVVVPPSAKGRLTRDELPTGPLKIVAGIDSSPASDAALAWLHTLDRQASCHVRFVHLYWPPREHERLGLEWPARDQPDREVVAVLTRELQGHVAAHFGRTDVPLRVRPIWGAEEDPLAWEAETGGADLLVVGTRQARGSTALATVRGAHVPVVCVPGTRPELAAPKGLAPIRTVLVTTDFSALGDAAVAQAYRLLLRGGGEVVLFHVADPGAVGDDADRRSELEARLLELVPHGMEVHGILTRTAVVADTSPGEAIAKAIRLLDPDLVVMSSHGRGGVRRAVRGSVAEQVMRAAVKPVLVVPASADATGGSAEDQI
jgi:nucleotide-binding universal stress UspA family protein